MKITKYPQSCLLVESDTVRILIDPGSFVAEEYHADQFGKIDAVLITHEHADHVHEQLVAALKVGSTRIVANNSTAALLDNIVTDIVNDGDVLEIGGVQVIARELPHVAMIDGSAGPQNTGYVIGGVLFHPGDGVKVEGVHVPVGAVPVAGPDLSPRDAFDLATSIGCKVMIPIHFDYFLENPDIIAEQVAARGNPFKVVVLKNGDSYDTDVDEDLTAS
jgi:L-ascorbate metabolism protein UlaG (beta-lactamase superfamily)